MEDLKEIVNAVKVIKDNSGNLTLGGLGGMIAISTALVKLHKKILGDPLKAIEAKIEKVNQDVKKKNDRRKLQYSSTENRIKEIDQLLEYQDKRLNELEEEDHQMIATMGRVNLDIDRIKKAIEGSNIDIQGLRDSWKELRDLDTQRQVAIVKVETILSMI